MLMINPVFVALGGIAGITGVFFIAAEIALNVGEAQLSPSMLKATQNINVSP